MCSDFLTLCQTVRPRSNRACNAGSGNRFSERESSASSRLESISNARVEQRLFRIVPRLRIFNPFRREICLTNSRELTVGLASASKPDVVRRQRSATADRFRQS